MCEPDYEREMWEVEYEYAVESVLHFAYGVLAQKCPLCNRPLGEAEYEEGDPSVGIWQGFWGNVCPEHGEVTVWDDGSVEVES